MLVKENNYPLVSNDPATMGGKQTSANVMSQSSARNLLIRCKRVHIRATTSPKAIVPAIHTGTTYW